MRLLYDPAVLRPLGCTANTSMFAVGGCNAGFAADQVRFTLVGGTGVANRMRLAQIRFEAIGAPGASTPLRLAVDQLVGAAGAAPSYRTQRGLAVITIDGDGVPDEVENGAPNNGDGNNDGIPDAQQLNVTSLPSPITGNYVTLVGPPGSCFNHVQILPNPSPADTPTGWSAVLGFLSFTLGCLPPGSTATVTVILHGESGLDLNQFFIYSPDSGGWQSFLREGNLGASFTASQIVLQLADGQTGDNDGAVNGQIEFLGAPGTLGVAVGVAPRQLLITLTRAGTYGVVLLARPSAPVLVSLATTNGHVAVSPAQLTFTLDNWSVMQMVTVRAVSGAPVPGTDVIRHRATSADAAYHGLAIADVNVTISADGNDLTPTPETGTPTVTPGTVTPTATPGTVTPTATPPGGAPAAYLPLILVNAGPTSLNRVYLPMVARSGLPDLIVEQISVVDGALQVTIRNIGTAPVLNEFWIDAYIGPRTPPTAVNQTWDTVGNEGLVWGITADALPMAPNAALTLAIGDPYFLAEYSSVNLPLTPERAVYVQVDSYGEVGTFGSVEESHEREGGVYNNITGPAFVTTADEQGAVVVPQAAVHNEPLLLRRRFRTGRTPESEE